METFLVKYEEDKTTGVYAISLVEDPAIEVQFVALSKEEIKLKQVDEEKRLLVSPVLIPNKKILRMTAEGEPYNIVFEEETIRQAQQNFYKKGYQNNSTLEHDENLALNNVSFVESWIKESETHDKSLLYGFEDMPVGTWFAIMKVEDDAVWSKVKSGEVKGFSIDGIFDLEKVNLNKANMDLKQIVKDALAEVGIGKKAEDVKLGNIPTASDEEKKVYFEGEMLSKGGAVFIDEAMTEPFPDGEHELMTNVIITVTDGIVTEIKEVEQEEEVEAKEEEKKPVEMSDDIKDFVKNEIKEAFQSFAVTMAKEMVNFKDELSKEVKAKETEPVALTKENPETKKPVEEPKDLKGKLKQIMNQ